MGSSNFDDRSFDTNDEISLGIVDEAWPRGSMRSSRNTSSAPTR